MHPKGREGHFGVVRIAKQLPNSPFAASRRLITESSGQQSSTCRQTPESAFCTCRRPIFFVKLEVPQRQQLASERTPLTLFAPAPSTISFVPLTRNLSLADPSPYPVRGRTGLSEATATRFSVLRKAREGAAACPGAAENVSRTTEACFAHQAPHENASRTPGACFAHRISAPYRRRGFPVPNITPVPEKPVFLHRVPLKMRRVPQEAVLRTARIFRTTGGPLRYRMSQTQRSHILRRRLPRHQHPHYGHPPHGSRLGQEATALRKNLCNFFKKLRELSRSFFIFVPNKYRNTQCKLFTTNTTNSLNLPR